MLRIASFAIALATLLSLVTLPAPASAEPVLSGASRLTRVGSFEVVCQPIEACDPLDPICDVGLSCATISTGETGCVRTDGGQVAELMCCTTSNECGTLFGHEGTCVPNVNFASSGVCEYGVVEVCRDRRLAGELDVLDCVSANTSGSLVQDLLAGDCDGDGIDNGSEEFGCVCDESPDCAYSPDGGSTGPGGSGEGFTGRGGCAATIAVGPAPTSLAWLLPLAGAVVVRRRRR